jgi:hypothetical protein
LIFIIQGVLIAVLPARHLGNEVELRPDGFTVRTGRQSRSFRWSDVDTFDRSFDPVDRVVFNFSPHYHGEKTPEGLLPADYGTSLYELAKSLNEYKARYSAVSPVVAADRPRE